MFFKTPQPLAANLVFPAYELISGRRLKKKIQKFECSQWLPREGIDRLQKQALSRLLIHAKKNVPFYRELFADIGKRDAFTDKEFFRTIPVVAKGDIKRLFSRLIAENIPRRRQRLNVTSGSTSTPMQFYSDFTSLDYKSAITLRGDRWAGKEIGTRHARLWGAPNDLSREKKVVNQLKNIMLNRIWLDSFNLSDRVLQRYVAILKRNKPTNLIGYATALAAMANYILKNDVAGLGIESIISSAEMLMPEQRERIEKAFRCRVYDRYGNREVGPIAVECESGSMHINSDFVKVELLKDNRPVLPGQIGEIVVTALHSYGMPLIRYNTGDLAIAAPGRNCPCGRQLPVIQDIIGRKHDILMGLNGNALHGSFFVHLFYKIKGIKQFQVVQDCAQELEISYVPEKGFNKNTLVEPERKITDAMGGIRVVWRETPAIDPAISGKHRYTISKLGQVA